MAGTGDLLSIGVSGLQAFQRNLSTVGHNISNVNTEGYSRQTVQMAARNPQSTGNGFIGAGVGVESTRRVYDQFQFNQVVSRNSTFNQLDTLRQLASGVDEILANDDAGLNPVLQNFFNALQDVSNNPTSIPARQVLISEADTLTNRFVSLDQRFTELRDSINSQLQTVTTEINNIAGSIAELNSSITLATGSSGGLPPNDLLDQRDVLINRLSELVSVSTVPAGDNSVNVFIGSGQTLVLGTNVSTIGTIRSEFDRSQLEVSYTSSTSNYAISDQITGGKLGGLLAVRNEILDPVQNALGRIAIGLASTFNAQHQLGDDVNGNPGGLFFSAVDTTSPEVFSSTGNNPASGTISVAISDTNNIKPSDYRLNYDGATFTLVRLNDNTIVDSGFTTGDFPRMVAVDGITLNVAGSVAAGDSFLIRPVKNAGRDIRVAIASASEFAAAASGNSLGDNSNVLALAALQSQNVLGGGTESYQLAYSTLVATIGARTNQANINSNAQETLLRRAVESQQAVSGVNLDEEAANLIKFQQAYQAAAQVIRISDEIFQTLLSATSR
ncbi:MAG: flagellar hook-associated protein FlgK [Ectothiorhodospiraceae bacterium]|nr:flagellar hook-associated protein FlgK [Ectothiorhodospiraceae bacterium]